MRTIEEMKVTSNSSIYNKLRKILLSKKIGLCVICPYHKGENRTYSKHGQHTKRKRWSRK